MVKKDLPEVRIRFKPVTHEGVASLVGSGKYDRDTSGKYTVRVYDESNALLKAPGATRSNFQFRCNEKDLKTETKIREEFNKYIRAASQNRLNSQSWYGLDISSSIKCLLSVKAQLSTLSFESI